MGLNGIQYCSFRKDNSFEKIERPPISDFFGCKNLMSLDTYSPWFSLRLVLTNWYFFLLISFRILKIESEFFKHVDLNQASRKLGLEMDVVDLLFRFWILKRRSQANRPLFIPRMTDDTEAGLSVSFYLILMDNFLLVSVALSAWVPGFLGTHRFFNFFQKI